MWVTRIPREELPHWVTLAPAIKFKSVHTLRLLFLSCQCAIDVTSVWLTGSRRTNCIVCAAVCACVCRQLDRCGGVLSGDLGSIWLWQSLVSWCSTCFHVQPVYILCFSLCVRVCIHSALISRQRAAAVRGDAHSHNGCYKGNHAGEGVSRAPDPRVAAAAEEETSRGGFWTQEKVCCLIRGGPLSLNVRCTQAQYHSSSV